MPDNEMTEAITRLIAEGDDISLPKAAKAIESLRVTILFESDRKPGPGDLDYLAALAHLELAYIDLKRCIAARH